MHVALPEDLEAQLTPQDARLGLALGLYVSGKLGFGRAAEVAQLPRPAFQRALARQRLPMDYSLEDLADDQAALQSERQ